MQMTARWLDLIRLMLVGVPTWRNTEFNAKFCISVFLLHAGMPTSISLMFSFIDNEIEAFMCMWLLYMYNTELLVTRVGEHLHFIACMFRDIISATMLSGGKHYLRLVLQLSKYFCRPSTKSVYAIMSTSINWRWCRHNTVPLSRIKSTVSDGVSLSPKGRGGWASSPPPPLNPPLQCTVRLILHLELKIDMWTAQIRFHSRTAPFRIVH